MIDSHALRRTSHAGSGATLDAAHSVARLRQQTALEPRRRDALRIVHEQSDDLRVLDLFRDLRAQLLLASGRDNPVILVSGIRRQCGTSFVARNLAASIALDPDHTAVLLDCNLRRPSLQRDFDLDDGPGLSDFLLSPGDGVGEMLRPSGIPRLHLITAGREPNEAAELVTSLRMRALVQELQQRYPERGIVLDAPPACGAPEARVLSQLADCTVLVAGEGMHTADAVLQASRVFDPARFAGVVFNQLP
jgi:protein-tyrosine kinase